MVLLRLAEEPGRSDVEIVGKTGDVSTTQQSDQCGSISGHTGSEAGRNRPMLCVWPELYTKMKESAPHLARELAQTVPAWPTPTQS